MIRVTIRNIVFAAVAILSLVACSQQTTPNTSQNAPIVIGASIANSGDFSADGKPTQQGYQLWADTINKQGGLLGRQVKLDLVNDNSIPEGVTTAYSEAH